MDQLVLKACYAIATKLEKHRKELVISCEEDCWCWAADALLAVVDSEMLTNATVPCAEPPTTTGFFAEPKYSNLQDHVWREHNVSWMRYCELCHKAQYNNGEGWKDYPF